MSALFAVAGTQAQEVPHYGGTLTVANIYYTVSPLSFDSADYPWKHNQDTGLTYEQLFAADLSKSKRRGGKHSFHADAWIPPDAIRGELAESWVLKERPWRAEIQLRKGVMFPDKPGVMAAREFTSDDVISTYERLNKSPKSSGTYYAHVDRVEANGKYGVTFFFKEYNAEWDHRFGRGYFSAIVPKEVAAAGAANWKNVNGTGPFALTDHIGGNSLTFTRNPNYWDKESIGGKDYKLPFADRIVYRVIKDESTMLAALRTGKIDISEAVRWSAADELKRSVPKLVLTPVLQGGGTFIALRMDTKPFDDIRVRQALNLAIDKQAIIKSYYGGHAEMLGFPMLPEYGAYYEPLNTMPASVQELFHFDPAKARKLLAEAGLAKGFTFKVQTTGVHTDNDLLQVIAAYLQKVGVTMEIEVMEYSAYLSAMTTKKNAPGYFMYSGAVSPTNSLRKSFGTKQPWNPSQHTDPEFDKKLQEVLLEPDERVRQVKVRLATREILEKAPHIWLPSQYNYVAWWPWVKNYGGELRAGAERPGPIHARVWVDQALKKKMGY